MLRRLRPARLAFASGILVIVAVVTFFLSPLLQGDPPASGILDYASHAEGFPPAAIGPQGILDSDLDGLADSLENFVYGTDPGRWNSTGTPIPDGWLARYGYDPLDPSIADQPAPAPPLSALPPGYEGVWPEEFRPSLYDIYAFGRPADWNESASGGYANGIDPRDWDGNGDGIADAFLIRHGIDPRLQNLSDSRLAGPEGLTVREAFEAGTDPTQIDTDGDSLTDRDEIAGVVNPSYPNGPQRFPPSNPRRFDSNGAGVCDGYLVSHGYDPRDAAIARGDPDRDGATTREEFEWSKNRFGAEACKKGAGLDPAQYSTGGSGLADGWLLKYGLDPLDAGVAQRPTQSSKTDPAPAGFQEPSDSPALPDVTLTVIDEYRFGRPSDWLETRDGPWFGGTDPSKTDTDDDGLADTWEIRGYYVSVLSETTGLTPRIYATASSPTQADSDGDGLSDHEEASPRLPGTSPTDARRIDTDFDGLNDGEEVRLGLGLNPARADTAGDQLRDGVRLDLLLSRSQTYQKDLAYEYPGPPGVTRSVADWAAQLGGAATLRKPLDKNDVASLLGPAGDADGDGTKNILDKDIDGDELLNGWEVEPSLYAASSFGLGPLQQGRPSSDPLNPDTDGDALPDGWEVKHGVPDYTVLRYNLDPGRWDSDGDGVGDALEDPDADSIEWFAFDGGFQRRTTKFVHANLQEYQYDTHPNEAYSDGDGLKDGWKVFWGILYPRLGPASTPSAGIHYPGAPGTLTLPANVPTPTPGEPQAPGTAAALLAHREYDRFVLSPSTKGPNETAVGQPVEVPGPDGTARRIYRLHGSVDFGFHDAQRLGTNPYLLDTDGDAMEDWWEAMHAALPVGLSENFGGCDPAHVAPDPLKHDGTLDADADELTNAQEQAKGSNPRCKDSDLAGIPDGGEVQRSLSPTDPMDDRQILDKAVDTDKDGLLDFQELAGRTYSHLGSATIRTRPDSPDSDGDGLLDGASVPCATSDVGLARSDVLTQHFLDLGIAYHIVNGNEYCFDGELDYTTDPREPDDSGTGVPAGWLVAHGFSPHTPGENYLPHYSIALPRWWNLTGHGPWWGGADPNLYQTVKDLAPLQNDPDLDRDGLFDRDGGDLYEDPFPAGNHYNQFRAVDYASVRGLTPPPEGSHPRDEMLDPTVRRLLAQASLNPVRVGARFVERDPDVQNNFPRETPTVTLDSLPADAKLLKGTTLLITGRVTKSDGTPVVGLPVEARMGLPRQSFGASFSGSDGRFSIPVNVTASHEATVPKPNVFFRGNESGTVRWSVNPALVAPGAAREILVRTFSTPTNPPYTTALPALNSAVVTLTLPVHAGADLTLATPKTVMTGASWIVRLELHDTGGAPLTDDVVLNWLDEDLAAYKPRTDGTLEIPMPALGHEQAGVHRLKAKVPERAFVTGAAAESDIRFERPSQIELPSAPLELDAGRSFVVTAKVRSLGEPVSGSGITVNITAGSSVFATGTGSTGSDGSVTVTITLPAQLSYGTYGLSVHAGPTSETSGATLGSTVRIRSLPRFVEVSTGQLTMGQAAQVSARLVEPDGRPLGDTDVRILLGGSSAGARTDSAGRFMVSLSASLPAGPALQRLQYDGDSQHGVSVHESERPVRVPVKIILVPGVVGRGGPALVPLRLVRADGTGVGGGVLHVQWGHEPERQILTDAGGRANYLRPARAEDAIGPVLVHARYEGSPDGGHGPNETTAVWHLKTLAELVLPRGAFDAGEPLPAGILRDAGLLLPIKKARITLRLNGTSANGTVTDDAGRFPLLPAIARDARPFLAFVEVQYPGNESYAPVQSQTELRIRSPVTIQARAPPVIVAGRSSLVPVELTDSRGQPVQEGRINITLGDREVASGTVRAGKAVITVTLPTDFPPAHAQLNVNYEGTDIYGVSRQLVETQIVAPTELRIEAPATSPGSIVTIRVVALQAGRPLSDAPIHLQLEGLESGLVATTDSAGVAVFEVEQGASSARLVARFPGDEHASPTAQGGVLAPATAEGGGFATIAVMLALAALALGIGAYVLYRMRRHPLDSTFRAVRAALEARGEVERRILLAYRTLEDSALALGVLTEPARTARLLQEALAPRLPPSVSPSLETLLSLFEDARYGYRALSEADLSAGTQALDRIIDDLSQQNPDVRLAPASAPEVQA